MSWRINSTSLRCAFRITTSGKIFCVKHERVGRVCSELACPTRIKNDVCKFIKCPNVNDCKEICTWGREAE